MFTSLEVSIRSILLLVGRNSTKSETAFKSELERTSALTKATTHQDLWKVANFKLLSPSRLRVRVDLKKSLGFGFIKIFLYKISE